MQIFKKIAPLKTFLKDFRLQGKSIGMVPTMGALHNGHLSLINTCQGQNQISVCTVFVNPTQFNNDSDLLKYPRTLDKDIEMLKEVHCDVLFCPETEEIYPTKSALRFDFGRLDKIMEGQYRPGHFSGVGLVVSKLLNIVEPDKAYFGQKDWQQFAIIRQLVEELNFNVELHSVPTLREEDGLALSSRNLRLTAEQRTVASIFYRALMVAKADLKSGKKIEDVKNLVRKMVETVPDVTLEYFEVTESTNLNPIENVEGADRPIICIAGYVGEVRLIDNMFIS
jgi:pantoate--beta-alanine ligase